MNENNFTLAADDRCLKTSEVAAMLGMSEKTLKTYRADGHGPAFVKFKGLVRYRLSDVKKWRDKNVRTPGGEKI